VDLLLVILLGGAIAYLWRRVDRLETALDELTKGERQPPRAATPIAADVSAAPEPPAARPAAPEPPASEAAITLAIMPAKPRWRPRLDFEDLFGRLLPIWAGGVALAVAGFFLVRWSIEAGLLTVSVRVILGFVFGLALLAAAEFAYRIERRLADPRVRQALAGAGLATLYASFYLAGSFYGLIGSALAFAGLAAVTAAAIGLSFRFGLPSAVLGLVGGFAAPALVGSEEANLPLLTLYLALVAAGLTFTGRRQDRAWLGVASLAGGLGWAALLMLTGEAHGSGLLALGALLVLLGAVLPGYGGAGRIGAWVRIGAAAIAAFQLAWLVQLGGFGALAWSLYLLLGAALAWFGWREPAVREGNLVAAAVAVFLLAFWPSPPPTGFAAVALALAAVFAGVPLAQLWRGASRWTDAAQVCGVAIGLAVVSYAHFGHFAPGRPEPLLALTTLALAMLPALAAWLGARESGQPPAREIVAAAACAAALLGAAGLIATPAWAAPVVGALLTALLLLIARRRNAPELIPIARGAALVGLMLAFVLPQVQEQLGHELTRMVGARVAAGFEWTAPLRWLAAAAGFLLLMRAETRGAWRNLAAVLATLAAYAGVAQFGPGEALPWLVALAALATAWRAPSERAVLLSLLALGGLWALWPLAQWAFVGGEALAGAAPPLADWPAPRAAILRLAPLAVGGVCALIPALRRGETVRAYWWAAIAVVALAALHVVYRHAFAAVAGADFLRTGMADRTVWEALLLAAAWAVYRFVPPRLAAGHLAMALASAALAHFAWFTLGVHDPLWSEQAVGPLLLANWLLPAYAVAAGALVLIRRLLRGPAALRWLADAALMVLIALLALSELRQLFSGSLLTAVPMSQSEDLLRSLIGIVAAGGFLLWGARHQARSWRVGSLVLMLIAVLKVFLFDADGLGGLARIASFMALGFSLIGIGWFYSRQLRAPLAVGDAAP
jgi:uncharacterized membrane protein